MCCCFFDCRLGCPLLDQQAAYNGTVGKRRLPILYVESIGLRTPKISSGRDLARMARRLTKGIMGTREVGNCIRVFSPIVIPLAHHSPFVRAFNKNILNFALKRFLRKYSFIKPMILTYHPFMLDAIEGIVTGPIIYHCVDNLSAVTGINPENFKKEEQRLLNVAKAVFTTSKVLEGMCSIYNSSVHHFPNVVDLEHFGQSLRDSPVPQDLERIPSPRICYIGALSDYKVDFELLYDVANHRSDWQLILIGEEIEGQSNQILRRLKSLSNVHFLGYRPYQTLPDYLRGMDVALLPTLINDYTRAMFPMKYFEWL